MKKLLILSLVGLALLVLRAQQVTIQSTTSYNIPPVTWSGADAQAILAQVAAITNAAGAPIIGTNTDGTSLLSNGNLVPGTVLLVVPVTADASRNLQTIGISGRRD